MGKDLFEVEIPRSLKKEESAGSECGQEDYLSRRQEEDQQVKLLFDNEYCWDGKHKAVADKKKNDY